jgi:hypothetical protein
MILTLTPFLFVSVCSVTNWPWGVLPKGWEVTEASPESAQTAEMEQKTKMRAKQRRRQEEDISCKIIVEAPAFLSNMGHEEDLDEVLQAFRR